MLPKHLRPKMDAGTAFESVAGAYEAPELPHTLPGNKVGVGAAFESASGPYEGPALPHKLAYEIGGDCWNCAKPLDCFKVALIFLS